MLVLRSPDEAARIADPEIRNLFAIWGGRAVPVVDGMRADAQHPPETFRG